MSATIAQLTATKNGFSGTLTTLAIRAPIQLVANQKKNDDGREPDFRVIASRNGFELGAGWKRVSQNTGNEYVSVTLRAPEFGTIYANMAPAPGDEEGKFVLIWNPREVN
ncbi:MAG: DUF736 domain-containing protein [Rhizobiaceae bacterium]|nr:DUF736 domain-containing protein [Rhizobiaceae bacterium]